MVIKIPLSQGKVSYIDEQDFHLVKKYQWKLMRSSGNYYAVAFLTNPTRTLRMHHLFLPIKDGFMVDHKDRNGLHNWRNNLRYATRSQNGVNGRRRKHSSSLTPYRGVSKIVGNKWTAHAYKNKKQIHIGVYSSSIEAAMARDAKAKELHGEFATLNNVTMMKGDC